MFRDQVPWGRRGGLPERNGFGRTTPGAPYLVRDPETGEDLDLGTPDPFFVTTGPLVLPASGTVPASLRFTCDAGYLACSLRFFQSVAGARPTVTFLDDVTGRVWQNRAVPTALVTGDGRFPYVLPTPALFRPNGTLRVIFAETAAVGATIILTVEGVKLRSGRFDRAAVDVFNVASPFFYSAQLPLAAGVGILSNLNPNLTLDDDADFALHDLQSDLRTNWDALIRTTGGGYVWSEAPVRADTIFGDGTRPGTLTTPLWLAACDNVAVQGTNQVAGVQTAELVFAGVKRWKC